MVRSSKILLVTLALMLPLLSTGCVYYPERPYRAHYGEVWVPAHWEGPRGDVWVGGHWR